MLDELDWSGPLLGTFVDTEFFQPVNKHSKQMWWTRHSLQPTQLKQASFKWFKELKIHKSCFLLISGEAKNGDSNGHAKEAENGEAKEEDKTAEKRKAEDDKIEPVPVSAEKVAKLTEGSETAEKKAEETPAATETA